MEFLRRIQAQGAEKLQLAQRVLPAHGGGAFVADITIGRTGRGELATHHLQPVRPDSGADGIGLGEDRLESQSVVRPLDLPVDRIALRAVVRGGDGEMRQGHRAGEYSTR